jgi:hypothetical protein
MKVNGNEYGREKKIRRKKTQIRKRAVMITMPAV